MFRKSRQLFGTCTNREETDGPLMNDKNRKPIEALLQPRSIALVGVSARGGGAGVKMMESAGIFGFEGPVWPIHPSAPEISGRKAFKTLADTPEPADCV